MRRNLAHNIIVLQPCEHQEAGSRLLCRMPAVSLPDDLRDQLNSSASGTINNTQGPGVAVYWSSDGRTRADIYIGLKLDGVKRYQNISSVNESITLQFALKPVVLCNYDDIDFDPNEDEVIAMKVNRIRFTVKRIRWIKRILVVPLLTAVSFNVCVVMLLGADKDRTSPLSAVLTHQKMRRGK